MLVKIPLRGMWPWVISLVLPNKASRMKTPTKMATNENSSRKMSKSLVDGKYSTGRAFLVWLGGLVLTEKEVDRFISVGPIPIIAKVIKVGKVFSPGSLIFMLSKGPCKEHGDCIMMVVQGYRE